MASDASAYAQKSAKPVHGARWFPAVVDMIVCPAESGRYGDAALFQLVGRTFINGGRTNMIPAKEPEPEEADRREVEAGADHGARDAGMGEGDVDVLRGEDRLADEEGHDRGRDHEGDHDRDVDRCLRPEHGQALGHGRERRPDHPGRVFGGDHEHSEDAERELRDLHSRQVRLERVEVATFVRVHVRPVVGDHRAGERRHADREPDAGEERPPRRAHAPELRPLRAQDTGLRDSARVWQGGEALDVSRAAHAAASSGSACVRNSTS